MLGLQHTHTQIPASRTQNPSFDSRAMAVQVQVPRAAVRFLVQGKKSEPSSRLSQAWMKKQCIYIYRFTYIKYVYIYTYINK